MWVHCEALIDLHPIYIQLLLKHRHLLHSILYRHHLIISLPVFNVPNCLLKYIRLSSAHLPRMVNTSSVRQKTNSLRVMTDFPTLYPGLIKPVAWPHNKTTMSFVSQLKGMDSISGVAHSLLLRCQIQASTSRYHLYLKLTGPFSSRLFLDTFLAFIGSCINNFTRICR